MNIVTPEAIRKAQEQLEAHLREIVAWHFSPETGCLFWLDWAKKNFDPRRESQGRRGSAEISTLPG